MDPLRFLLDAKKAEIKALKVGRQSAKKKKDVDKIALLDGNIAHLESFIKKFSPSKMQPINIDGIVINYKLYQQFLKKLKGFVITEVIKENCLELKYSKGAVNGTLVLENLTPIFPEGSVFKKGDLQEGVSI